MAQLDPRLDPYGAFVDRVAVPSGGDGPLSSVRLAIKDNIAVAGLRWTAGLPLYADRIAHKDAACVATLRQAGATIVGTVATDSAGFGMTTPGVANPIAPGRTAGGSSGGSAAAVAGGLADLALGTDTGGSVRVPAACCGLYGLKPTYGRISVEGVTPLSFAFDHVGLLAANIETLEKGWLALSGQISHAEPVTEIRRIGFDAARLSIADGAIRAGIEQMLSRLVREGCTLVEVELPDQSALGEIHGAIVCGEALEIWREHWPVHAGGFTKTAARSLSYSALLEPGEIVKARHVLVDVRRYMAEQFAKVDAILGPTIAVEPPEVGARQVSMGGVDVPVVNALLAETCPFNVSGHPALSLPLASHTTCGTPVALQIAVKADRERSALAFARTIANIEAQA